MDWKNGNEWKIDSRMKEEIEEQIEALAASYVPEWHFDRENPDIGSALGKIFAGQMEGNIGKYNQVLDRYHTEFVDMLGVSLLPARPSAATVLFKLVKDTIPGVEIRKGTKLLAETEDEDNQIIFETQHPLYVTNSTLEYAFMTIGEDGRIVPLKGGFLSPSLVEGDAVPEEEQEPSEESGLKAFRLFGKKKRGIEKNALLFYHPTAMDVEDSDIYMKMKGGKRLLQGICKGAFECLYFAQEGFLPVTGLKLFDEETMVFQKEKPCRKTKLGGRDYSLLAIVAKGPVKESISIGGVWASSSGMPIPAESVGNGSTDFDVDSFEPFGDTLSLFQECYIGCDAYFRKAGALIELSFDVSYLEHPLLDTKQEEDNGWKIIKRRPRTAWKGAVADARAEEVSFEYFNGIGWKKLRCMKEARRIFADGQEGHYGISFLCPEDWEEAGAGAYQGRCIRMQLLKADDCYMRPCIHHYPKITGLRISFSFEGHYMEPERLIAVAGTRKYDLTAKAKKGEELLAFQRSGYRDDALYLGFTKKLESGPVSLLFQMEEGVRFEGSRCRFEYSSMKGFRQMKVLDHTAGMSRSGTVMFMPQADMHAAVLEGKKAYWIRISRMEEGAGLKEETLPIIKDICFNAVLATNVETREEEDFYLEESVPGMTVDLGIPNILDLDLWVNEKGSLSSAQMRSLLERMPRQVRAEYDMMGNFSAFYVKWQEAGQLSAPPSKRCYLLDRMNSRLVFGDGISTKLPKVLDDVAFKALIRCCNGSAGNVEAGRISEAMGSLMFVEEVRNPVKAYGGSSIESLGSALKRGANILKSRRRLVSVDDYIQEILGFSDTIDKVRCVVGRTIHGEERESAVTFVVLLKDFAAGSYSFHNVAGALKSHLLEACELTVAPKELHIVEPIFASVSVDVWAEVSRADDSFEIQGLLSEALEEYLDPVGSESSGGWEIGAMPLRSQLLMSLSVLKGRVAIRKMTATVQYTDQCGIHETDLEDLKENPFLVCRNGKHHVNIMLSGK